MATPPRRTQFHLLRSVQLPCSLLLLAALGGCATTTPPAATTADAAPPTGAPITLAAADNDSAPAVEEPGTTPDTDASATTETETEAPRYGNFSEDLLVRTILAELAGQRGQNQQALDDYVELARETGDLNIIKRTLRIATYLRNSQVALEMGDKWLALEPDSTEARQTIALQMLAMGRYRDALEHLQRLLELGQPVDFRLVSARVADDSNAELYLDALISDFQDLNAQYPEDQSLRLALAHLYQQNEQPREAYEFVHALASDMNDAPEVVILEVQLLELLGENARAEQRLADSLRTNPEHKQLRFLHARKLIEEQHYDEAREQFKLIVQRYPDDYDMLYSLALLSMEINMLSEARNHFESLVANGHRLDDAHYYLGYIASQENRSEAAIEHYLHVNGGNNFLQAQRNLTELMIRADRYPEVKAHLQNIRFRNADYNIPLLTMEANVLMDEGQNEEASTLLDSAIGAFPNSVQLLFLRSVLSQNRNDLMLMEQDLRRIIQLNPSNPVAYNSLGYTLADRTQRYEEAYELIQRAVELAPDDPAIIDSLGWVQYRLGMYEEARRNLDRAYELYPDHEVAAHLGEVLWVMGNRSAATRIWRNALEVEPDSEFIRKAMERLDAGEPG